MSEEVFCILCGYETLLFEEKETGCPECSSSDVAKLNRAFEKHPVEKVDGSPKLFTKDEASQEIARDIQMILPKSSGGSDDV